MLGWCKRRYRDAQLVCHIMCGVVSAQCECQTGGVVEAAGIADCSRGVMFVSSLIRLLCRSALSPADSSLVCRLAISIIHHPLFFVTASSTSSSASRWRQWRKVWPMYLTTGSFVFYGWQTPTREHGNWEDRGYVWQ